MAAPVGDPTPVGAVGRGGGDVIQPKIVRFDAQEPANPTTADLLAEMDLLVPEMRQTLGADADREAQAGAALALDVVIDLAITALGSAAEDLRS